MINWEEIITPQLIGMVIGALFTLLGVVSSSLLNFWSLRKSFNEQKLVLKRKKLEEIAEQLSTTLKWIQELTQCRTFEDYNKKMSPVDAHYASVIASLYFPELVKPLERYSNSLIHYYNARINCFRDIIGTPHEVEVALDRLLTNPKLREMEKEYKEFLQIIYAKMEELAKNL